jgi:type VI secretion system secreted protein VgrG
MMAPLMGLAGVTSGLLTQAMGAAGVASGGGLGSAPGMSLMSSATSMVPAIAGGAIGVLSSAGQSAQLGVVSPSSPLADAGTALAASGASLGAAVGSLFSLPGMLNVSVANTRTDSIGIAHAMQVGMSQSVNIGQTKMETIGQAHTHTVGQQMIVNVGQQMQLNVGETFQIIVGGGAATLTMDNQGNVRITGKTFTTVFTDQVTHYGKVIDHNPS